MVAGELDELLGIAAVMLTLPVLYPAAIIIISALALFCVTSFVMRNPVTREQTALVDPDQAAKPDDTPQDPADTNADPEKKDSHA